MNLWVAFSGLAAGIIVWSLLVSRLRTRSWETAPHAIVAADNLTVRGWSPAKVGLCVFLAVITSLFALFLSAYYMRMGHGHVHQVHDWHPVADPPILWFNTLLLLLSSITMQWATRAATQQRRKDAGRGLIVGGGLAVLFIAGQIVAWRQLRASGYVIDNPAVAFFYVLTAVHGVHLMGGLTVWSRTTLRLRHRNIEMIELQPSIALCAMYWHYLLLVWLVLFIVLLST